MKYLFILFAAIFILVTFFLLKMRQKNKILLQNSKRQQLLVSLNEHLKEINKPSNEKKMNKEEVQQIKKNIEETLEQALDGNLDDKTLEKNIEKINYSLQDVKNKTKLAFEKKDELIKKINYEVGRFKTFLSTNVFYPKEFLFTANRLEGKVIDLQETKPEKLSSLINDIEKELFRFQNDLKEFFKLHNKLKSFIANTPELTGNDKQEIYFHIQNGKFEQAEALMDKYLNTKPEKQYEDDFTKK
ncbi:hypothetical protein [Bacillus thuringiensis]|uniref:hypothetical protein n=1 Tax=Bacillus thuringiensis TaxID=1428 RepID=UPI0021D66590|nr:hypothetical protein [Bacillus thuringiensis]MCU7666907.1 hypothetical protein [Bacillus thuringiensis]